MGYIVKSGSRPNHFVWAASRMYGVDRGCLLPDSEPLFCYLHLLIEFHVFTMYWWTKRVRCRTNRVTATGNRENWFHIASFVRFHVLPPAASCRWPLVTVERSKCDGDDGV